jgi:hypothetical protein
MLDDGNLRAVEYLEKIAAQSKHFKHQGGGRIITRRGAAYVILDVPRSLRSWIHCNDPHLSVRIGWSGTRMPEERVCVRMNDDKPLGDACVSFVKLADCGWPRHYVPATITVVVDEINRREALRRQAELKKRAEETKRKRNAHISLLSAIGSKDVAILRSAIERAREDGLRPLEIAPAREALSAAAEAHADLHFGWLFEFVSDCAKEAADRKQAEKVLRDIRKRGIEDAVHRIPLTTGFLLLAANSVTRLVKCGLAIKDVETGFKPLFDKFSPRAIAAMSQLWMVPGVGGGGVPEAEVLDRYLRSQVC